MIVVDGVGLAYMNRESTPVLRDVTMEVNNGEFVVVVGASGTGKTTLLRLIGGLIEPTTGSIRIGGLPADEARRQRMFSYVFQRPALLPWRSVRENIELPLEIAGEKMGAVDELLDLVGLAAYAAYKPHQLSGGMQQRVAIARALAVRPSVLLMDEPLASLDELTRESLQLEILRIWRELTPSVVLVTHQLSEAVMLADRVIVLGGHPANIVHAERVPFERPRSLELKETTEFQQLVGRLRRHLTSLDGTNAPH
jgi:NitT/TauT family transport system ATP-binding protein